MSLEKQLVGIEQLESEIKILNRINKIANDIQPLIAEVCERHMDQLVLDHIEFQELKEDFQREVWQAVMPHFSIDDSLVHVKGLIWKIEGWGLYQDKLGIPRRNIRHTFFTVGKLDDSGHIIQLAVPEVKKTDYTIEFLSERLNDITTLENKIESIRGEICMFSIH